MKIIVTSQESNMEIYLGDAELFLEMNDNDTELEVALNLLDGSKMDEITVEHDGDILTIQKEIELIYEN